MKKSLLLVLVMFLGLNASQINWQKDYKSALSSAKKDNKSILVFLTTPNCKFCKKLENTTFKDEKIVSRINAKYSSVHLTKDVDIYPKKLSADGVPMIYFLDYNENIIDYSLGYWNSEDFKFTLDDVKRKLKKMREKQ